jgi:flagellar basal-body rod modification protein FlgD
MTEIDKSQQALLASLGLTRSDKATVADKSKLGQEDFLSLLTAQMQNQDPMEPLQNGEFLSQIAQFSTVSGIQDLQKSFSELSSSLFSNQALQASVLVGRNVQVPSSVAPFNGNDAVTGMVTVPSSSENVHVDIMDAAGQVVTRLNLGSQPGGNVQFTWDGSDSQGNQLPAGNYAIQAVATSGGQSLAAETRINARVESVSLGKPGEPLLLNVQGLGKINFEDIREIS